MMGLEYHVSIKIDGNPSGAVEAFKRTGEAAAGATHQLDLLGGLLKTAALATAPGRITTALLSFGQALWFIVTLPLKPLEWLVGGLWELVKIPFELLGGALKGVFDALGNIVQIALGGVLFKAIEGIGNLFTGIINQAYQATAQFQYMRIGLEGLLAQEIAAGTTATRSWQVANTLTEKQNEQLVTLKSRYVDLQNDIAIVNQRMSEWNDKTSESTRMSQREQLRGYQEDLAGVAQEMADLEAVTKGTHGVTEQFQVGVTSISEAMPTAIERAKGFMDQLTRIGILSPYKISDVFDTFRQFKAFQFPAEEAKSMTTALLDMAAGIGADNTMLNRMAYNLAQVRLQNKVTALDIRQLAQAGLGLEAVLQYVGKRMGIVIKDHNDFNAALEAGKITWSDFTKYFAEYSDKNFGGAARRMAVSLKGIESTLSELFLAFLPKITEPLVNLIAPRITALLDSFLSLRDSGVLEWLGRRLEEFAKVKLDPVFKFIDYITKFTTLQAQLGKTPVRPKGKFFLGDIWDEEMDAWNKKQLEIQAMTGGRGLLGNALEEAFGLGKAWDTVSAIINDKLKPALEGNFAPLGDWFKTAIWQPLIAKIGEGWMLATGAGGWADQAVGFVTKIINQIAGIIQNPSPELTRGLGSFATGLGGMIERALFGWEEEGEERRGGREKGRRHAGLLEVFQNLFKVLNDKLSAWLAEPGTREMFSKLGKGVADAIMSFTKDIDYLASLSLSLTEAILTIVASVGWNMISQIIGERTFQAIMDAMKPMSKEEQERLMAERYKNTENPERFPVPQVPTPQVPQPPSPAPGQPGTYYNPDLVNQATGGWAVPGKNYRVNERGGEAFFPRQTGYIAPSHALNQAFNYNVQVNDSLAASMLMNMLRQQQRARVNAIMG